MLAMKIPKLLFKPAIQYDITIYMAGKANLAGASEVVFAMKYADRWYAPELLSLKIIALSRGKAMYAVNMASNTL